MPEITEAKLYEAFGLEAPAQNPGAGGQVQEPAEPVSGNNQTAEGAQGQELAEPAASGNDPGASFSQQPAAAEPQEPGKQTMTPEERHQNAARRRQQEQQAAIDQAVQTAIAAERQRNAADLEQFFGRMGIKNTYTGQPIRTMEEFQTWKGRYDSEQFGKDLKAGKATPDQFNQMIENHPAVQQAQQVIAQSQAQQRQQQAAAAQQRIDADLAEIAKLNPTIQSVADLLAMPKAEEFKRHVARGNDFLSAYKLTYFEELSSQKAERARQQALTLSRGKDHLQPAGSTGGSGAVSVPSEVMAMYRAFNPGATDAQIQAHYNKTQKKS